MRDTFKKNNIQTEKWITDILGAKTGDFGSGFYRFTEFPIGKHTIAVIEGHGYQITIDLPEWFDPYIDDWPHIEIMQKSKVLPAIQYLIDYINRKENTNYKMEFTGNTPEITVDSFTNIIPYIFELYRAFGLADINKTSYRHYYKAIMNERTVDKNDAKRSLWDNMTRLELVENIGGDTFRVTSRGLNILQGFLMKRINVDDIELGKVYKNIDDV